MPNITADIILKIAQMGSPPLLEHGPDYDAVFDPFVCDGEEYYQYYDASIRCWMIDEPIPLKDRRYWGAADSASDYDRSEDIVAANALSFMPRPDMPAVLERDCIRGPFWHGAHRFFWFLRDLEEGWILALAIGAEDLRGEVVRLFYQQNAHQRAHA